MTDAQGQKTISGHCLCGACRFFLTGPHNWIGHCHCESCRRATSSPVTTWIGQEDGQWHLKGLQPASYHSSEGVTRGFCPNCGSQLFYRNIRFPDETHFYAALLDDPADVKPEAHYHADEAITWLKFQDDLPHK